MTRDDIIRLAREACDKDKVDPYQNDFWAITQEELERFAALVAAAEREACAEICERRKSLYWMEFDKNACDENRAAAMASEECADAIRARGESK